MTIHSKRPGDTPAKRWIILIGAFVPIWVVVLLAGWIVLATLMPISSGSDMNKVASDKEQADMLRDFAPAAGPSD
jgi:hypothetical protein